MRAGPLAAAASIGAVLSSCGTIEQTTSSPRFQKTYSSAEFCPISAVKQKTVSTCGLACLETILRYWELEGSQDELSREGPPAASAGYSLAELKAIAENRGLTAFAVSFELQPRPLLHSQLERGRPVLLAIDCPLGRYFGDPIPVIEYLDSSVVSASVRETRFTGSKIATTGTPTKDHYVVAFGYDKPAKRILLMDPAYGLVSVSESRLMSFWSDQNYAALVCARPASADVSMGR